VTERTPPGRGRAEAEVVAELYGEVAPAPPEDREEGHVRSV